MRYTIKDFQADFPDDDRCLEWLKDYLFPDGIYCPNDQKITPHHKLRQRKAYSCELCGHHTYPTADTIFHKSSTPLTLWFYAIYLMASTRAGISAKQLERELGVTYKTAWRMFHQIRSMMGDDGSNLKGEVEIDEVYLQPIPNWKKSLNRDRSLGWRNDRSQIIFGMAEREGKVKVKHVKSAGARVLLPEIEKSIEQDATIYSDEATVYTSLNKRGYTHHTTKHRAEQYVDGTNHTQNIENFWSNMKRGIRGVYRHVEPQYLQAYADEYAFRYSHRHDFQPMFWAILSKLSK